MTIAKSIDTTRNRVFIKLCTIITLFAFYGENLYTQTIPLTDGDLNISSFGKPNGFDLEGNVQSMVYDDDGWLWISGIRVEANNFMLGNSAPQLLRTNGKDLYNVELPENIVNSTSKFLIFKKSAHKLYIVIVSKDKEQVYTLDTKLMTYKQLNLYSFTNESVKANRFIKTFNSFIYVEEVDNTFKIYDVLDSDKLVFKCSIPAKGSLREINYIKFNNDFLISNTAIGIQYYNQDGKLLKSFNRDDFETKNKAPFNLYYDSSFINNDKIFIRLKNNNAYYKLNKLTLKWIEVDVFGLPVEEKDYKYSYEFFDSNNNIIVSKVREGNTYLYAFKDFESKYIWRKIIPSETANSPIIASRDIESEIVFNAINKLFIYSLNNNGVSSYLNDLSIRSMIQIDEDNVIVATDFDGWYKINLTSSHSEPIEFTYNGKPMSFPSQNRDLYYQNNIIWSNDNRGLLEVNIKDFSVKRHIDSVSVSAMHQNDETIILAEVNGRLLEFNKTTKKATSIIPKDSFNYERIIRKNETIYAATNYGLAIVKNKKRLLFAPKTTKDKSFIFIDYVDELGIIIGTQSGKVFLFNENNLTFTEIYEDTLSASVASILKYQDYLWINTFAGIVAFNYKTNKSLRFGTNDGFSHYEANRHSFLRLDNGKFLIGTIKGVNLFDPNQLLETYQSNLLESQLKFVEVTYFNNDLNSLVSIKNSSKINSNDILILKPLYNSIKFDFALITNTPRLDYIYRYRLNNNEWTNLKNSHTIHFDNVAAGSYNLQVQAYDTAKNIALASTDFNFEVKRIFYRTIWFYSLLLLIIGITFFIIFKNYQKTKEAKLQSVLLKQEVEYKHKDLKNFAANIIKMQDWNDEILKSIKEISKKDSKDINKSVTEFETMVRQRKNSFSEESELLNRVNTLNSEFYEQVLKDFPNLSKAELKLFSLIKLKMSNKEIATIQNISVSSVYQARYRLRKKLNLTSDDDLDKYLMKF